MMINGSAFTNPESLMIFVTAFERSIPKEFISVLPFNDV